MVLHHCNKLCVAIDRSLLRIWVRTIGSTDFPRAPFITDGVLCGSCAHFFYGRKLCMPPLCLSLYSCFLGETPM